MKKLSLTYEKDNIIIPVIDPSTMPNTSPDKFSKKTGGYATKVTQLPDEEQPEQVKLSDASDVDESYKWVITKESCRQQTWMMIPADVSTVAKPDIGGSSAQSLYERGWNTPLGDSKHCS